MPRVVFTSNLQRRISTQLPPIYCVRFAD